MGDSEYKTLPEIVTQHLALISPTVWASLLDIDDAHIYRAKQGDFTKTFVKKMVNEGLRPRRVRISADISPNLRDAITADARLLEITNGEMIALMWQAWNESKK